MYTIGYTCSCGASFNLRRRDTSLSIHEYVSHAFEVLPLHTRPRTNRRCKKSGRPPAFDPHPQENVLFEPVELNKKEASKRADRLIERGKQFMSGFMFGTKAVETANA